jgi:DNA repair protein RadD
MRLHPSKTNTLVLDFAGNILRHGPIDRIRVRAKAQGGGVETAPMRECPACKALVLISASQCDKCGHSFESKRARKPNHETKAAELEVMSGGNAALHTIEVDRVSYRRHEKPGKPSSLRVVYYCGLVSYSEWICLEHSGYPRQKAESWWRRRAERSCRHVPDSVTEALEQAQALLQPREIVVNLSGRYPNVIAHRGLRPPPTPTDRIPGIHPAGEVPRGGVDLLPARGGG